MAKIVAFSVPDEAAGNRAIDRLPDLVDVKDVALVYRTAGGGVRIRQTTDATMPFDTVVGGLLGAVVGTFVGPFLGVAAAGAAAGGLYGALRDKGVDDRLMRLAGEQLAAGGAAVFVLAEDATADYIEAEIRIMVELGEYDAAVEVGSFPVEAQALVREELKLQ